MMSFLHPSFCQPLIFLLRIWQLGCIDGEVRLADGTNYTNGRVEICLKGDNMDLGLFLAAKNGPGSTFGCRKWTGLGSSFGKGGPLLAAKNGPWVQFWQPNMDPRSTFS